MIISQKFLFCGEAIKSNQYLGPGAYADVFDWERGNNVFVKILRICWDLLQTSFQAMRPVHVKSR